MQIPKTLIILLIIISLGSCADKKLVSRPLVNNGKLNLLNFSLENAGEIDLDGQWEFYWNQFLDSKDFTGHLKPQKELMNIPGKWSEVGDYSDWGYGTLRLQISGLTASNNYSLYIPEMLTAFRLFLDGKEIYKNGVIGTNSKESVPQFLPGIYTFEAHDQNHELICQISNYDYRNSAIWRSIRLGTEKAVHNKRDKKILLEMFLAAVLFTISIFHFGLFIYRTEAKSELLFGLTCLVMFFRTITTGEQILTFIVPQIPWEIARKIEFSPFYLLAPLFMTFIASLFPKENIMVFNKIFLRGFALLTLFYVLIPVKISNNAIFYVEIFLVLGIIYTFSILIRALVRKRDLSKPIIIAFFILAVTTVNDILFSMLFTQSMYLAPFGFLIFIFIQSQMLSKKYASSFHEIQTLSQQLKGTNKSLSRFVPFQFLEYLKKDSILDVNLGDQVEEQMTIFFADIRSFTSLSEVMTPEENFKFLNSFLSQVVPVIREQGGFVDKFTGDGIMALFPYPPDKAVLAAIELQKAVENYNVMRSRAGYRAISLGIGIHMGQLILGTIGETNRMETTVIADAVNIASRLESLTKRYGAKIIISRELFENLKDVEGTLCRSLGDAKVKGKKQPIEIVEVLDDKNSDHDHLKIEYIILFEEALKKLKEERYSDAAKLFISVLEKNPEDMAAGLFLQHCIDHSIEDI